MRIARRATLEEIGPATWPAFAKDIRLAASFVRRRVKELTDAVIAELPALAESPALAALDAAALNDYTGFVAARATRLSRTVTK
jgi:hypothetical protein